MTSCTSLPKRDPWPRVAQAILHKTSTAQHPWSENGGKIGGVCQTLGQGQSRLHTEKQHIGGVPRSDNTVAGEGDSVRYSPALAIFCSYAVAVHDWEPSFDRRTVPGVCYEYEQRYLGASKQQCQ